MHARSESVGYLFKLDAHMQKKMELAPEATFSIELTANMKLQDSKK
jgi:hypothetical protein